MEIKTWYTSQERLEKEIEYRTHFGWVLKAKTEVSFTMQREDMPNCKRLRGLEQQFNSLRKKAPIFGIVSATLGSIIAFVGCVVPLEEVVKWIIILIGGVMLLIGLAFVIAFLMILPYRKKMIKEILDQGDQLQGKKRVLPIRVNIKEPEAESGHIKKAIYDGELDIRY